MHSVIFCNGDLTVSPHNVHAIISNANLIIAADGGANHLKRLNIKPNVIVGDMDSISEPSLLHDDTIKIFTYKPNKDQTDTELAVLIALERGYSHITLLGATGKRLDHTIANIELLKQYPGKITLIDGDAKLIAINNTLKLISEKDTLVSMFPCDNGSIRITSRGLRYNLNNQKLAFPTQGISNVMEEEHAEIHVKHGTLLIWTDINTQLKAA